MSATIHPMSVVDPAARLGEGVVIGPFCIVGPHVSISAGSVLTDCIVKNSIIGENADVNSIVLQDSLISDNAKVTGNQFNLNVGDSSEIIMG